MDVVRRVRHLAGNCKTGHAGTLDPLATGVLICCLGRATRHVDRLMGLTKIYETMVDLSAFTNTDDAEGPREPMNVPQPPELQTVRAALDHLTGEIQQVPPAYSAIKVGGKRAYKLARQGEQFDLPARTVRIDSIEILSYEWPHLRLRIACGKGTYIRSLARQIGQILHTGGHLTQLRRTAIGPYTAEQATPLDRLPAPITPHHVIDTESHTSTTPLPDPHGNHSHP